MKSPKNRSKPHAKRLPRQLRGRNTRRALVTAAALTLGAFSVARGQTAPVRSPGPNASSTATSTSPSSSTAPVGSTLSRPAVESKAARLARWQESFDAFAAADRVHAPQPGGVLFVGSSSIRLWDNLEEDFQSLPVITKRGFGGSRLSDCSDQVARLVLPYKPTTVIVYAGDNDLAEGATPADVLASFRSFVAAVHQALPETRIAYLSIKPSPLRASLMAEIRQTNALIAAEIATNATAGHLDYIDIYDKMLGPDGQPRRELFRPDLLHLNPAGYALWRTEISSHLDAFAAATAKARASDPAPRTTAASAASRAGP